MPAAFLALLNLKTTNDQTKQLHMTRRIHSFIPPTESLAGFGVENELSWAFARAFRACAVIPMAGTSECDGDATARRGMVRWVRSQLGLRRSNCPVL